MSSPLSRIPGAHIGVRYLLASLGFWVLFNSGTLLWHQQFQVFYFRQPYVLALTHLAALGWLTTGLMGVMYATLPATLRVRPNSLRMAHVQYWLQVFGIAGLTLAMSLVPQARWRVVFGLLTLGALVIFAHNIAATVGRGKAWHLPEAHFVMAIFYLAITGLIGMTYIFYLNWGAVPQTMTHLKVHAHFAGLGWFALTLMGLTYKLLPLELGVDKVAQKWSLAASVLINLVFWGVFFGYAYDWPGLRLVSAALGLGGVVCHTAQVQTIARAAPSASRGVSHFLSLPYTRASCLFGIAAALLALLLTTGAVGDRFAVEYAYGYAAGAGWFGLYVTGQTKWLMPLLHDQAQEQVREPAWMRLEFPGQVAGTALLTAGLLLGVPFIVAVGAAVNLAACLLVTGRSLRLCLAQPAMAER
ncbi:MAG TPA: hypothetical protein VLK82_23325 [Candidatus Tectomicrobia bacterium]|nr:hypothetical protein [Candidatus Tectomicrobia bacterium]